jgi:LCP family protein required for cell wall assembly
VSLTKPPNRDRIVRSAVLGLLTYALGLIPFYFLTPVREAVPQVAPLPVVVSSASPTLPPTVPTPTGVPIKSNVGGNVPSVPAATPEAPQTAVPLPTETVADSRYAFLLLGYGGGGHDGAYLTDSLMLVIVDPDRKTLALLSFPRDTWVPLLFDGTNAVYNKVNTAYAFAMDPTLYPERLTRYTGDSGPGTFAVDTISRLVGLPIRYYLGLDFSGFRQMIDAVGGIDVTVPTAFAAQYPANDDPSIDASWTVVRFTAGRQHLNGERAIEYARAREVIDDSNEGNDFARSRRQRLIIEAFQQRLLAPGGLVHLPQLLSIGATHVSSNYGIPDVAKLSQLILSWQDVKIYQSALTDQNYLEVATGPDGTYALVPGSPDHSWSQIQSFVKRFWNDPASASAMAQTTIVVENDTGVPGTATRVSAILSQLGYNVGTPTSSATIQQSRLVDQDGQVAPALARLLAKDLQLTDLPTATDLTAPANSVVLQLGADDLTAADLVVPVDERVPLSVVGIEKFGEWAPDVPPADVVVSPVPAGTLLRTATPERTPGTGTPERTTPGRGTGTATPVGSASRVATVETSPSPSPLASPTIPATPTLVPSPTPHSTVTASPTIPAPSPTLPRATPTPRKRPTATPRRATPHP